MSDYEQMIESRQFVPLEEGGTILWMTDGKRVVLGPNCEFREEPVALKGKKCVYQFDKDGNLMCFGLISTFLNANY